MIRTLALALSEATARLTGSNVPDAARDARRLLAYAAGIEPGRLTLHMRDEISAEAVARLDAAVSQRCARRPVSQIVGTRLFWGRDFRVTPDVLDPRPETETLVQAALDGPFSRVLDLGTGSGILAVTLLAERPEATGVATDISQAALAIADHNAHLHGVGPRLELAQADWGEGLTGAFDLIVSNPPYIAPSEISALEPDVRLYEPLSALTDGADGLAAYRAIAACAPALLRVGGRLCVEHGAGQDPAVREIFEAHGLSVTGQARDLDGRIRVLSAAISG